MSTLLFVVVLSVGLLTRPIDAAWDPPATPVANDPVSLEVKATEGDRVQPEVDQSVSSQGPPAIMVPPARENQPLGPAPVTNPDPDNVEGDAVAAAPSFGSKWLKLPGGEAVRVVGALVVVLGLILGLKAIVGRSSLGVAGGMRPSGVLSVLARYPLARGQSLVLIKLGRRVLLVHQTASALTPLSEVVEPDEVASLLGRLEAGASSKDAPQFRRMLSQFESEHQRQAGAISPGPIGDERGEIIDLTKGSRDDRNPWLFARRNAS